MRKSYGWLKEVAHKSCVNGSKITKGFVQTGVLTNNETLKL